MSKNVARHNLQQYEYIKNPYKYHIYSISLNILFTGSSKINIIVFLFNLKNVKEKFVNIIENKVIILEIFHCSIYVE